MTLWAIRPAGCDEHSCRDGAIETAKAREAMHTEERDMAKDGFRELGLYF